MALLLLLLPSVVKKKRGWTGWIEGGKKEKLNSDDH